MPSPREKKRGERYNQRQQQEGPQAAEVGGGQQSTRFTKFCYNGNASVLLLRLARKV